MVGEVRFNWDRIEEQQLALVLNWTASELPM